MKKYRLLFLFGEIHNFQVSQLVEIAKYTSVFYVIYQDRNTRTNYRPPAIDGITYVHVETFNLTDFIDLVDSVSFDMIRISGWDRPIYRKFAKIAKTRQIKTVVSSDTSFRPSIRRLFGIIYFRFCLKGNYDKILVPGPWQYEYARLLGFRKSQIVFNNLSANTEVFQSDIVTDKRKKQIVFVGFHSERKIGLLLEAWEHWERKKDWQLVMIGNGPLKSKVTTLPGIVTFDFDKSSFVREKLLESTAFILPSFYEPWGIVVHEAASSGCVLLLSNNVGSGPVFLSEGFNGFSFDPHSIESIIACFDRLSISDNIELAQMSKGSVQMGAKISLKLAAKSLIGLLSVD